MVVIGCRLFALWAIGEWRMAAISIGCALFALSYWAMGVIGHWRVANGCYLLSIEVN